MISLKNYNRKTKFENLTTFYFEDEVEVYAVINVTKYKSGYDVEYNDYRNDIFRHTDGIKNMEFVNKWIERI